MDHTKNYEIIRINGDSKILEEDLVVVETAFTIFIDGEEIITILSSPKALKELCVGYIFSEGWVEKLEDIKNIDLDLINSTAHIDLEKASGLDESFRRKKSIASSGGKASLFSNLLDSLKSQKIKEPLKLDLEIVKKNMIDFNRRSELFQKTGGVHSCGLYFQDEMLVFEEDIGRHNALDKIIGRALLDRIDLEDKMVLTSGRVSSEILIKIAKRGISTIVSMSAPTNLAIELAKELSINLLGFVRGERLNIYTNLEDYK